MFAVCFKPSSSHVIVSRCWCVPTLFYSRITVLGHQPLDRCVCIARLSDVALPRTCCVKKVLTNMLAPASEVEENSVDLNNRLPGTINKILPVMTLITCRCDVGSCCHTPHLGMTSRYFHPNSAFSFNISCVAELGWGKQAQPQAALRRHD